MRTITRIIISTALCILNFTFSFGQEIEWQNTIGGSGTETFSEIQQTIDGGYILAGYSRSNISGDKTENSYGNDDYWIVKTDSIGDLEWQRTIGGDTTDCLTSIKQTTDKGYILGGYSLSNISGLKTENSNGNQDYWVIKLDSLGNILWQNTIGGAGNDVLRNVKQTFEGGYIITGWSSSGISGDKTENTIGVGTPDCWIVKLDSAGSIQWQNTIGGAGWDDCNSIEQTLDGGYILGASSTSSISGDKTENSIGDYDYWLIKIDSVGNIQWQNTIGGSKEDQLITAKQTSDGGYILGGYSESLITGDKTDYVHFFDYWIIKTDSTGNILWQSTIGGFSDDYFTNLESTSNGQYILSGRSSSGIYGDKTEQNLGVSDYWIIRIDSSGNILWQNSLGGAGSDRDPYVCLTTDDKIVVGGNSYSDISGDKTENSLGFSDYWVLKLTETYNIISGKTFLDLNANSVQDNGEPALNNKTIVEQSTGRFVFIRKSGLYNLSVLDSGFYTVEALNNLNYYNAVPVSHSAAFTGINQTDSLNDFAFHPAGAFNDLCVTITPLGAFRPGFDASYMINYENVGTTTLNGTVKIFPDNVLSFVSSTPTPVSVNADSIEWNVGVLAPFQIGKVVVTFNVTQTTPNGTVINSIAHIEPIANDANASCNIDTAMVVSTGSYDPNDILVSEDTLTTTQLATQPYLDYTIRFQNTGNDTAFTVKIINPIDTNKLNLSTIEFVNASHPVNLKWINYNRNMEFTFENILLPDSNINEPLSHGFVHYRIKPKTSLLAGDSVTNNAYIYFDFNAPVETNTAITRIVLTTNLSPNPSPQERGTLLCYPNPAVDELNISLKNGKVNQPMTVKIFDVLGKEILKTESKTSLVRIPLSWGEGLGVRLGIYFVEVISGKEVYRSKFVKE